MPTAVFRGFAAWYHERQPKEWPKHKQQDNHEKDGDGINSVVSPCIALMMTILACDTTSGSEIKETQAC
jgi:hypothetical protein